MREVIIKAIDSVRTHGLKYENPYEMGSEKYRAFMVAVNLKYTHRDLSDEFIIKEVKKILNK